MPHRQEQVRGSAGNGEDDFRTWQSCQEEILRRLGVCYLLGGQFDEEYVDLLLFTIYLLYAHNVWYYMR